jgi:hypothetical protein
MSEHNVMEVIDRYCTTENDKKYLSCALAFQIVEELKINAADLGKICDENNIKLKACRLGCF